MKFLALVTMLVTAEATFFTAEMMKEDTVLKTLDTMLTIVLTMEEMALDIARNAVLAIFFIVVNIRFTEVFILDHRALAAWNPAVMADPATENRDLSFDPALCRAETIVLKIFTTAFFAALIALINPLKNFLIPLKILLTPILMALITFVPTDRMLSKILVTRFLMVSKHLEIPFFSIWQKSAMMPLMVEMSADISTVF